jgi:hypothetical protein
MRRSAVLQVVDAAAVHARRAPDDAVHLVAFPEKELGEIRTVLTRDARDERRFRHACAQVYGLAATARLVRTLQQ